MPRIHMGHGNRRSGPSSSRSRRSSAQSFATDGEIYDREDPSEFDQFDYNGFEEAHCDYDDDRITRVSKIQHNVSSSSLPRRRAEAMRDLSESSKEELRPERKLVAKRKSGVGDATRKVVSRSIKPTVTSPRITISDLSTNCGDNTGNNQLSGAPKAKMKKALPSGVNSRKKSSSKKSNKADDGNAVIDLLGENKANTNCGKSDCARMPLQTRGCQNEGCLRETDDESEEKLKEAQITKKQKTSVRVARHRHAETISGSRGDVSKCERLPSREEIRVLPLRGLAIDNRAIPTETGHISIRHSLLKHIPQLVEGGLERGVLSQSSGTILASLTIGAKCPKDRAERHSWNRKAEALIRTAVVPRASHLFEGDTESSASWLCNFLEPINISFGGPDVDGFDDIDALTRNKFDYGTGGTDSIDGGLGDAVEGDKTNCRGPKGFTAGDSWGYFGAMVEEIEHRLSASSIVDSNGADITIFTSDSNLFADVRSSAHVDGLEMFWRSINKNLHISAVTVIVVDTTSIMQIMKRIKSSCDKSCGKLTESNFFHSASFLPNRLHLIQCINDIRQRICKLNQGHLESSDEDTMPVNLQLEFIECNSISFQILLQAWVRQSFGQTFSSLHAGLCRGVGGCVRGRLRFDLPETLDGTTCSISLDLQYTVLPHRVSSPAAAGLVEDMSRVSSLHPSSIEVVQSIPLSSIDSSLIFGTPMRACAGMESDVSRYNEMKMLARQLWRYLGRSDVGLVLRARTGADRAPDKGVAWYSSGEQMFLLVSEESVQQVGQAQAASLHADSNLDPHEALRVERDERDRGEVPCHGMVYRYAAKSQILHFGNEERMMECEAEEEAENSEVGEQYLDYIERSLDTLVKTGLNPLLMGESIINS